MDVRRYTELFLSESRDYLTAINQGLLELERAPESAEPLDSVFRALHTLKGTSGMMGYDSVGALAHDMEALLASVRSGDRVMSRADVTLLFEAADALEAAVERATQGGEASLDRDRDLMDRLQRAVASAGLAEELPPSATIEAPAGRTMTIRVHLTPNTPLRGARALLVLQRVRTLGIVTSVSPAEDALAADGFGDEFMFRFVSDAGDAEVERTVRAAGYVDRVTLQHESKSTRPLALDSGDADSPMGETGEHTAWTAERLAAPLQRYVRIDLQRLDALMNLVGELVITRGRLAQVASGVRNPDLDGLIAQTSRLVSELQDGIMASRMVPVWQVFDRFPRVVRDAARDVGKEVELVLEGRSIELDRSLLEQMSEPIVHLLRNAVDHGLEPPDVRVAKGKPRIGRIVLSATRDRSAVMVRVSDDGRGIDRDKVLRRAQADGVVDAEHDALADEEVLRLISRPGFSTAERVTPLSGRGVGIDAVATRVRALGGSLELRTVAGEGTTFSLRMPTTLAILPAILTRVGGETYALPLTHIRETLQLTSEVRRRLRGRDVILLRDEVVGLRHLREVVGLPARDETGGQVVVLEVADRRAGLVVDQLLGQQEIVVKPFDAVRGAAPYFSGATILSDGAPALIVEVGSLF